MLVEAVEHREDAFARQEPRRVDERQLRDFLLQQPAAGLQSSYWLPDGATRQAWLEALSLKAEPELPLQLLIDPSFALLPAAQDGTKVRALGIATKE